MGLVLIAALSLVVSVSGLAEVTTNYHDSVGIPTATKIKEAEDAILAGTPYDTPRIVGGSVAAVNAHPYMGGLLISFVNHPGTSVCGSTLVSDNRLVTAAHCWFDGVRLARQFTVVLASQFLFSGGIRIATSMVVMHSLWAPSTLENDVAVIYLSSRVPLSASIRPANLPHFSLWDTFVGQWAVAAGYGMTNDQQVGVSTNTMVREVNLQVISVAQCQAVYGTVFVRPSTLCTSGFGGVGICGGDSGGPLIVNRNGQPTLIGVSSFTTRNGCERGNPSGFARVTSFYNFIMQHM